MSEHGVDPSRTLAALGAPHTFTSTLPDVVRMPGTTEANPMFRLGEFTGSVVENRKLMEPVGRLFGTMGSSNGAMAALVSALIGALGGAGFGAMTRRDPLVTGAIGAGIGGLGGLGVNRLLAARARSRQRKDALLNKRAFYVAEGQDPLQYIQARLFEDGSLPPAQLAHLSQQVRQLPQGSLIKLADLLRTAVGGAVGYLVARFLLNMGGVGTTLLSGLGALAGAASGSRTSRNAFGQDVDVRRDMFGQSRFVL